MYVITFYSFKGGVGRTMALVNIAAELARRGRKVLVVDFDLEAPGLETYKHLRPQKPHEGIVEYVTQFRRTFEVPNLLDYIYETKPIGKKGGRLWVMPAGRRDRAYRNALASLDWQRLYKEEDGFLLFEDTKKGWEEELKPDYVLIDSRTGDTDVLGICTRQLPDAVVLMFTPNEQNLAGLEGVCRDIRREEAEGLKKKIRLHFVAANVPDLDDEHGVLRRQIQGFRKRLDFKELSGVIRRYENLNLLNQSVFTLDRPRTRLARSFRRLLQTLIKDNYLADREGALAFLEGCEKDRQPGSYLIDPFFFKEIPAAPTDPFFDKLFPGKFSHWHPITKISIHYATDLEVLTKVAKCFQSPDEEEHKAFVWAQICKLQGKLTERNFCRAMAMVHGGEIRSAADEFLVCLGQSDLDSKLATACLKQLRKIAPNRLLEAADVLAVQDYRRFDRLQLADFLSETEEGVPRAGQILREFLPGLAEKEKGKTEFLELLLRARCWKEAIQFLEIKLEELAPAQLFLLALAYWGKEEAMPENLCRLALDGFSDIRFMDERDDGFSAIRRDLVEFFHYSQAKSWLLWRLGKVNEAIQLLNEIEEVLRGEEEIGKYEIMHYPPFSFWRFRRVSPEQFLDDCRLVRRMFQGEPLRPAFLGPVQIPATEERIT